MWGSRATRATRYGAIAALALLGACARPPAERTERSENPADPGPESVAVDTVADWTAGIVYRGDAGASSRTMRAVRVGRHEGFDRVVFEFDGAALPGYHVEYIDRPVRACGSGRTTEIAGDGWLEIRFEAAAAHDPEGRPTVSEREQAFELPVVREVELTCDFEARVTWVVGTASPNPYRVLELGEPSRLAVDLQH